MVPALGSVLESKCTAAAVFSVFCAHLRVNISLIFLVVFVKEVEV
jgi:hypothetical protein